ncbi:MAG: FG-GAP repeat protein [Planctomycetes bacterium]|nr:FG-GAP repeat protein [Planctomycetota bacterium]
MHQGSTAKRPLGAPHAKKLLGLGLLVAAGCGAKVKSPARVPYVEVWELAQFADLEQDYGAALSLVDMDADGERELLVGAPARDPDRDGVVLFVSLQSLSVVDAVLPWRSNGDTSAHHDEFGKSLVWGDWNRDTRIDLAVGDPGADVGSVERAGEVWVFFGPIDTAVATRLSSSVASSGGRFGETLAAGDFDFDGYQDLACGAPHPAEIAADADGSSLEVFFGPDFTRHERWEAGSAGGSFGAALVSVPQPGGGAALVAGAPELSDADGVLGGLFAWERFVDASARRVGAPRAIDSEFGRAGSYGDFDGDGRGELAVAALAGRGGVYFLERDRFVEQGRLALPAALTARAGAPLFTTPDLTGDSAEELLLLSSRASDPAALLFSPGRGLAHLVLDFAAAAAISSNFDWDDAPELLLATPTSLQSGGGLSDLSLIDVSWQDVRSLDAPRRPPVVIPGVAALRGRG